MSIKKTIEETPGILQVSAEWEKFLQCLQEKINPKIYVEIGIEYGGTLSVVRKIFPECRCIGIDVKHPLRSNPGGFGEWKENLQNFEFILGDSHSPHTLDLLKKELRGETIDLLFIDAAHYFDDVYQDWKDYAPLANHVALHDIVDSTYSRTGGFYVHFLWQYLKTQYEWEEFIYPDREPTDHWGGIGMVYLKKKLGLHPLPTDKI